MTQLLFSNGGIGCEEYCVSSEKRVERKPYTEVFPLDSLSDHKLVAANVSVGNFGVQLRVAAWNVLNEKYAQQHMGQSQHGQQLHQHSMASKDAAKQKDREKAILDLLDLTPVTGFDIICLQEVSASLLDMIKTKFPEKRIVIDREKTNGDGSLKDCNVIIARKADVKIYEKVHFFDEDEKTKIHFFRAKIRNQRRTRFNIVTAHMPWDIQNKFPRILLAADTKGAPTLICGDFNCGVRMPVLNNGVDHLIKYSDPRFVFPRSTINLNQPHAQAGATHVCCMRNIAYNPNRMLDVFDHIMILLPPPANQ